MNGIRLGDQPVEPGVRLAGVPGGRAGRRSARLRPPLDVGPPAADLRRARPADRRGLHGARRPRPGDRAHPARPVRRRQHVPQPRPRREVDRDHRPHQRRAGDAAASAARGSKPSTAPSGSTSGSGFGQRLDWLAEAVPAVRALLDGETVTSAPGGRYAFEDLRILPRPVQAHLPIVIGGSGERKTLPIVAQLGGHVERLRVARRAGGQGRDPARPLRRRRPGRDARSSARSGCKVTIRATVAEAQAVVDAALDHNRTPRAQAGDRPHVLDRHAGDDRRDDARLPARSGSARSSSSCRRHTTTRRWRR